MMQSIFTKFKYWLNNRHPRVAFTDSLPSAPLEFPSETVVARDGFVTIVNCEVVVSDPDETGDFATIEIPNDARITVTIDGVSRLGRVIVQDGQRITVTLHQIPPVRKIAMIVSKNALEVVALVRVTQGAQYHVRNVTSARHAVLEVESEVVYPEPITAEQLLAELQQFEYQGEVDHQAIAALVETQVTLQKVVMRGTEAIPGQPARYIAVTLPQAFDDVYLHKRVDTVSMGTTVAVVEDGLPGLPGSDVYGNPITPPTQKNLTVLGDGITSVGGRLVALRSGQLLFTKSRIDVIPELIVGHDVTSKDGHIQFDGNVIIYGSLLDGSFVEATGTVEIHGSILCSTVIAERGAIVEGVIVGSQTVVGQSRILYKSLQPMLVDFLHEFEQFMAVHSELVERARGLPNGEMRIPMVADLLISKRHQRLDMYFQSFCNDSNHLAKKDNRYLKITLELRSKWIGIARTRIHAQDVERLHQLLRTYLEYVESVSSATPAMLQADGATSSTLRASGKIRIIGAGIHASSLESGETILVRGSVRGGFLVARTRIRINQLGTPSGTESSVRVLDDSGRIIIRDRYPNTVLQVGGRRHRNFDPEHFVVYRGEATL